jgi:hypothetical protein
LTDSEAPSHHALNLLEWLSARGLPDAFRASIVALSFAFSLAPYLGGATIAAITIPKIPAEAFWPLVVLTPIWWCVLIVRLIGAPVWRIVAFSSGAVFLSVLSVILHGEYPTVALDAMIPNFDETRQISFPETQHTWIASHERDSAGEKYCHFRTRMIDLGPKVRSGCTLRIDKIEIDSNGSANVPDFAAFDLEAFISSAQMLPEVTGRCVPRDQWQSIVTPPDGAEVEGRAVIMVREADTMVQRELRNQRFLKYSAKFDFETGNVTALPELLQKKVVHRKDITIKGMGARVQLAGWTGWEPPATFALFNVSIRASGRMLCPMW